VNSDKLRKGVGLILEGLDLPLQDPNFADTPARVARAYEEILSGLDNTQAQVEKVLSVTFPASYSEIVVAKNIVTFSLCPHHLLPVRYSINIGYLPKTGGGVLGISKLARLVEILAHRPVLQEGLTTDITTALSSLPGCLGAACVAEGDHMCMTMRGAKQISASIITSSVCGIFRDNAMVRAEFMALIKQT
jgi:GTP cyclohydrolase I